MLKVTVERSKWIRSEGSTKSYLLRPADEKMCCLGFACLAAGLKPENIYGVRIPIQVGELPESLKALTTHANVVEQPSAICFDLMKENDREGDEVQLTFLGEQAGIEFTFVD